MTIEVYRKGSPFWSQLGPEITARGTIAQDHDVIAWGSDFAAVARFKRGATKAMIAKAFDGLDITKSEKRK